MNEKTLKSKKLNSLVKKIRSTKNRSLMIHKPNIKQTTCGGEKHKTVLAVESGNTELGTIKTKSSKEASSLIKNTKKVKINIGWDKNKNEKLVASFIS